MKHNNPATTKTLSRFHAIRLNSLFRLGNETNHNNTANSLVMQEGAYKTLAENSQVEFQVETDANGKLKAINVTQVGGAPLVPPPRERRFRKPREEGTGGAEPGANNADLHAGGTDSTGQANAAASSGMNNNNNNGGKDAMNRRNGRKGKPRGKKPPMAGAPNTRNSFGAREPPFHAVISEDNKNKIADKGLKLVRNTVDLALGAARIKLGQGGYASLVDAKCLIGEGTFVCDEQAKVTFTWERCLELQGGGWALTDLSKLPPTISLLEGTNLPRTWSTALSDLRSHTRSWKRLERNYLDISHLYLLNACNGTVHLCMFIIDTYNLSPLLLPDDVKPVEAEETPEHLWGPDKPDPQEKFAEHGFKMKRVILTRPKGGGGRGRRPASKAD